MQTDGVIHHHPVCGVPVEQARQQVFHGDGGPINSPAAHASPAHLGLASRAHITAFLSSQLGRSMLFTGAEGWFIVVECTQNCRPVRRILCRRADARQQTAALGSVIGWADVLQRIPLPRLAVVFLQVSVWVHRAERV